MSFSDEYKAGYSGNYGPGVDTFSYSFNMGQNDRERQIREGTYGRSDGGFSGIGGGGPVLIAIVVIVAITAFLLAWITYPIAGILTGITFALVSFLFSGVNGVGLIFILAVPCYIVFRFAFMLEQQVAKFKPYRIFRQGWRIFAGTGLVHALARRLHGEGAYPGGDAPIDAYIIDAVLTILAPFVLYLNSMRLDLKYKHAPIRFKWLDLILAPIKNRFVPVVAPNIHETDVLHVREAKSHATMNVQVAGGRVTMGDVNVPVGNIQRFGYNRHNRIWLGIAGLIVLFIFSGVAFGGNDGEAPGVLSQVVGLSGLAFAALLFFWAFVPGASPDKLGGPFRFIKVYYMGEHGAQGGVTQIQFKSAEHEHRFVSAVENGLKAMPRSDPNTSINTFQEAPAPAN